MWDSIIISSKKITIPKQISISKVMMMFLFCSCSLKLTIGNKLEVSLIFSIGGDIFSTKNLRSWWWWFWKLASICIKAANFKQVDTVIWDFKKIQLENLYSPYIFFNNYSMSGAKIAFILLVITMISASASAGEKMTQNTMYRRTYYFDMIIHIHKMIILYILYVFV